MIVRSLKSVPKRLSGVPRSLGSTKLNRPVWRTNARGFDFTISVCWVFVIDLGRENSCVAMRQCLRPRDGPGIPPQALGSLYPPLKHTQRACEAKASQLERERSCSVACVVVFGKGGKLLSTRPLTAMVSRSSKSVPKRLSGVP